MKVRSKTLVGVALSIALGLSEVAVAESTDSVSSEHFECLLEPSMEVDLGGGSPGVVRQVAVERGSQVRKGQVLVKLTDGLERAALQRAQVRIARGKRKLKRNQALYEMKMLTPEEKDDIEMDIRLAEVEAVEARERLKLRQLRSPIDGVVIEREIDPGELLGDRPVLKLASLDPLHGEAILPARYFGAVAAGQQATISLLGPPGGEVVAVVDRVDPVIDPGSGTFRVRLNLENAGYRIPAGLRCEVRLSQSGGAGSAGSNPR